MAKSYTEEEVKELMEIAWWGGQGTSRYCPNLNGSCKKDIRDILKEHNNPEED